MRYIFQSYRFSALYKRDRRRPLSEQKLLEIVENLSENEDGLDFSDADAMADPNYMPSGDETDEKQEPNSMNGDQNNQTDGEGDFYYEQNQHNNRITGKDLWNYRTFT